MHRRALFAITALLLGVAGVAVPAGPAHAAAPTVSSFSPLSGVQGTQVTVTGTGFTGATAVRFAGTPGTGLTVLSDTSVRAAVPAGALTGPVSVVTPGGTGASSTSFKVQPRITSFSPTSGPPGTVVTVTGTALTTPTAVRLAGQTTSFSGGSFTSLSFTVPAGAVSGTVAVTTAGGTHTSASSFTVTVPEPAVALDRSVGPPTSVVTMTGSAFAPNEAVDIYADTTDVKLVAANGSGAFTAASLVVPASAPPGPFWFTAVGRRSGYAAQVSFLVRTDWRSYRNGALGRGFNPHENVLTPATVANVESDWSTVGQAFANVPGGAVVAGGLVITPEAVNSTLVARRPDGTTAWSRSLTSSFFNGPTPAVANGIVVASSTDGLVHAFSLTNGAVRWTSAGPSDTSDSGSPVIAGSTVYVPGATALRAFTLATGALQWTYSGSCTAQLGTPAVSVSTIAFACTTNSGTTQVRNYLSFDGVLQGSSSTAVSTRSSAPVYAGGSLLTLTDTLLTLTGDRGFSERWRVTLPAATWRDPVASAGLAVVCGGAGVRAYSLGKGFLQWADADVVCNASPTVAGALVYVPEPSGVAVFDLQGRLLTHLGTAGSPGAVAVADGAVYAAVGLTGTQRWALPSTPAPAAAPSAARLQPDRSLRVE